MTKKTVGKICTELIEKQDDNHTIIDQARENLTEYEEEVYKCVNRGKVLYSGDFFVVVLTKRERLFHNAIRNYFLPTLVCPTPNYDQTVYKYNYQDQIIDYLWTVPCPEACDFLVRNMEILPPDHRELIEFVLKFNDGTLLHMAKKLNNEKDDSIELEK